MRKKRNDLDTGPIRVSLANGRKYAFELDDLLGIDTDVLLDEMAGQPSRYGHIAVMAELARSQRDAAKDRLDLYLAEQHQEFKQAARADDIRMTEAEVRAAVLSLDRTRELSAELAEQDGQARLLSALCAALMQRRDMLMSINSRLKAEAQNY